jgi:hypothetical protein
MSSKAYEYKGFSLLTIAFKENGLKRKGGGGGGCKDIRLEKNGLLWKSI